MSIVLPQNTDNATRTEALVTVPVRVRSRLHPVLPTSTETEPGDEHCSFVQTDENEADADSDCGE
jgi:hypothetical protein